MASTSKHNEQPPALSEAGRFLYTCMFYQYNMKQNFSGSESFLHINPVGASLSHTGIVRFTFLQGTEIMKEIKGISNFDNHVLVQSILNALQAAIEKYGLKLLQRYPDDLLVYDKGMLERFAVPGAKIAWMVGHSHTHLVPLGLHPKENKNVTYMTNLGNDDKFFELNIRNGSFSMNETKRENFSALSHTEVPFDRKGDASNFWLYRQTRKIGHIALESVGNYQERIIKAVITPVDGIASLERAALEMWCTHAIVEKAGTLFVHSEVSWAETAAYAMVRSQPDERLAELCDVTVREGICA